MSRTRHTRIFNPGTYLPVLLLFEAFAVSAVSGYTVTGRTEDLLLVERDMRGFRLKSQVPSQWLLSDKRIVSGIRQTWVSEKDGSTEVMADVCLLKSTELGNRCAHFTRTNTSGILSWGSYKGQFLGDKLWLCTNAFGNATFLFLKYNAAVRVGMVKCTSEQKALMEDVARKILRKMGSRASRRPTREYGERVKERIPEEVFEKVVSGAAVSVLRNFRVVRRADALWVTGLDGRYRLGRQREWRGVNDVLVGISICGFRDGREAEKAAEIRRAESHGYLIKGDLLGLEIPEDIKHYESVASVVFAKGPTAVHIYQYRKKKVDIRLFERLIKRLAPSL
jgi:hypothetical protein